MTIPGSANFYHENADIKKKIVVSVDLILSLVI